MFLKPDVVLEVNKVHKRFSRNYARARKQLMHNFWLSMRGRYDDAVQLEPGEFWALKDISFELKRGETLGLIGLNGSGKSTLLKMINGIYLPDHGEINIEGEVGGLIELNAGIQPNLSGRDNIFVKGALLGRSRTEMMALYDPIVEFAELGDFINSPVRTYSSGMKMRLGFSIAIHMQPDILLMDEVMAVGDFRFRQKCLDRVNAMRETMSVIFVSHSMNQISLFCDRVIVLDNGRMEYEGDPKAAIEYYLAEIEEKKETLAGKAQLVKPFHEDLFINEDKISNIEHYWADADLNKIDKAVTGQEVNLVIRFSLQVTPRNLVIGVPLWDSEGNYITAVSTDMKEIQITGDDNNFYKVVLNFPELILNPGNGYVSVIAIVDGPEFFYRGLNNILSVENYRRNFGFVTAPHKWKIITNVNE
jgi:ABC-type polysaccharide/polyol phosphate transport system ATPase subunit